MKKIIAIVLAIVMMAAISVPAFAAFDQSNKSAQITVSYGISEKYTLSVPADVDLTLDAETNAQQTLTASNVVIPANKKLVVSVTSTNTWNMLATDGSGNAAVPYTLKLDSSSNAIVDKTATILEVTPGSLNTAASGSVILNFATTGTSQSGKWADTLTFGLALDNYTAPTPEEGE